MFYWMPPVGCALFALLLLAGGMVIWWHYDQQTKAPLAEQNALPTHVQRTDTLLTQMHPAGDDNGNNNVYNNNNNNNKNNNSNNNITDNDKPKQTLLTNDTQLLSINSQTPVTTFKPPTTKKPTLTGYYNGGTRQKPEKEQGRNSFQKKNNTATEPEAGNDQEAAAGRYLPFATPRLIATTGNICITTNSQLPGVLFPEKPSPDSNRNNSFIVSAGLQWQAPVPFSGRDHYFKGPNAKDQPYQLLIPGFWLGARKNKHQLIATITPFTAASLPTRYYEKGNAPINDRRISDSPLVYKSIVKVFGLQTGLHYNYNITAHWWIGAGTDAHWWNKGLVLAKPVNDTAGIRSFLYSTNSNEEKKITPFQISALIETSYQLNAWEGILQLSRPWNATIKGQSQPLWLRLGIRYRLVQKKIGR